MPNLGRCESLAGSPPTPNPAPSFTPIPALVTHIWAAAPASVPEPARKPVPVDADGPARMIPKRAIVVHNLKGVLARSRDLDDEGKILRGMQALCKSGILIGNATPL